MNVEDTQLPTAPDAHTRLARWRSLPGRVRRARRPLAALVSWPEPLAGQAIPRLGWRALLLEWGVIVLAVLVFCGGFLDLGTQRALPGNESEIVQSLDWVLVRSLAQGHFPLWNPYLQTGLPFVADPFLHVYNPLATLPVLLFGVTDGFKLALLLSFLAAGLGTWWLALVLGIGRPGRLWAALMYAFTGQAVARFFQGEYDFVLAFAWIPWALGSLMMASHTRKPAHVALAALSLALLFFSGNVYYAYYMLFVLALYALVTLFSLRTHTLGNATGGHESNDCDPEQAMSDVTGEHESNDCHPEAGSRAHHGTLVPAGRRIPVSGFLGRLPSLTFRLSQAKIVVLVSVLALGLIAVQLLPLVEFWPHITKPPDPQMAGAHSLRQIWLDYVSKDPGRADAIQTLPPEEFYAYIGLWPFLALAGWRKRRRQFLFLGLLLVLAVLWVDVRHMPWRAIYANTPLFNQFRYPTRMLIFGALALVVLAAAGLDALWQRARTRTLLREMSVPGVARWALVRLGLVVLAGVMVWSVADVYLTNSRYARTRDPYPLSYDIARWLRASDPSTFYVGNPNGWHGSLISNGLRYIDAWYGFTLIRPLAGASNRRPVFARPNYAVLPDGLPPEQPDAVVVQRFETHTVYRYPHSLPFVFAVEDARLNDEAGGRELASEEVTALVPAMPGPNRVQITTDGSAGSTLVVLMSAYPGWRLLVDGQAQALRNVGGYLAANVLAGVHRYEFIFSPVSFRAGLAISLLALAATLVLLVAGLRVPRRAARLRIPGPEEGQAMPPAPSPAIAATYREGAFVPDEPVDLPDDTRVRLIVEAEAAALPAPVAAVATARPVPGAVRPVLSGRWLARRLSLEWALFGLGMLVYALTRLWALDRFPIYFFADEATNVVLAEDLLSRGFHDAHGALLPIYFEAAGLRWTPLLSVYVHAISLVLFGKSILVTRATSAVVSLLGVAAVGLILKLIFKARYWWVGVLLMTIAPAWFLHTRTGFETVMMVSFFACFLLCYLLYRTRSPRYLYAALLFGAATFYTYSNGQMIMAAAGGLLALSDLRYHLRKWRTTLPGLALLAVLMIPLLSFRLSEPNALPQHLRAIDSYWFRAIPLQEKLVDFSKAYTYGLSPAYWYVPNDHDLVRHRMKGYGNLNTPLLPFLLIGVGLCLWKVRSSPHRAVLLAALATPVGAALVDISITRVLAFVVPATLLTGLGLDWLLSRLDRRVPSRLVAVATFVVFAFAGIAMLRDTLVQGPLWYRDYGLYGMQFGAKQLFEEVLPEYLARDPNVQINMTSTWANGADTFLRFFLPPDQRPRVQMLNVDHYMEDKGNLTPNILLVMTPSEYERARTSPKFKQVNVELIVPYPDGNPGFYFARLAYADDVDAIFAAEREERRRPVEEKITLDGQQVTVSHSQFEAGQLSDLFDGDAFTLVRGRDANPLILDFTFSQPRVISGLTAIFGSMDFSLTARLDAGAGAEPVVYTETYRNLPPDPKVEMAFDKGPPAVTHLRLEVQQLQAGDTAKIHVREVTFH